MGELIKKVVNPNTGKETTTLIRTTDPFTKYGYLYRKDADSIRFFTDFCISYRGRQRYTIFDDLLDKDLVKLFKLLLMLGKGNFIVKTTRYTTQESMTEEEIFKYLDCSKRYGREFINRMIEKGIMKVNELGYSINPLVACRNFRINFECYVTWRDEFKEILPVWAIKEFEDRIERTGAYAEDDNIQVYEEK